MSAEHFREQGYELIPDVISSADCDAILVNVSQLAMTRAGTRNLLQSRWCKRLADAFRAHAAIASLLGTSTTAVQCTLFEKSAERNWGVSIHQDIGIPVRERVDAAECMGWAIKEGVLHTQPPPHVLARLVALRLHLDACPTVAGPLRVVPRSHRIGRLNDDDIERLRKISGEVTCVAERGAVLLMRPLLLHASSRIAGGGKRRVLHFLFGPPNLPFGLNWHIAV